MICWLLIIIYVSSLCHATDLRFFIGDIVIDRMRLLSSDSSLSARPDLLILLEERNGLTLVRRHLCFGSSTPNTPKDKDVGDLQGNKLSNHPADEDIGSVSLRGMDKQ